MGFLRAFLMMRKAACRFVAVAFSVAATVAVASPPVAPTEALSPAEERAKFRLPKGFEIQLVASEPEIQKPINMAFDARGRLWVTHSVEYPFPAAEGTTPRDGLTILDGIGADGRAKRATLFADGLNIPIGVLPLPRGPADGTNTTETGDAAIVWSIPNIWKLTDTDGDGRADRREILYGPFDFTDTHGNANAFRLGPDGWVYACHGYRNHSKVKLRGEGDVVLEMKSGHTFRFRPDGSAIEKVTVGQTNPFGQACDALGNRFAADCHSRPITMLLGGACYEALEYHLGPPDPLGFGPRTTRDGHGSTGISGMVIYEADRFPAEYRGAAFVGNVITNVVHLDRIEWRGSSPWVAKPQEFLACDDWWFRPVDLQLGPDGAVYVADFYNCIIGHYEVDLKHPRRDRTRGRIWRVVWTGGPEGPAVAAPADIASADRGRLVALLGDPNLTVRRLAAETIAARFSGDEQAVAEVLRAAVPPPDAAGDAAGHGRAAAVEMLWRLGRLDAGTVARLVGDPAPAVRVHLVRALGDAPGWDAARADIVRGRLADADPFVRRAAAAALAQHPERASIPPLLRTWSGADATDEQLVHACRIAVRAQLLACEPADVRTLTLEPADWLRLAEIAAVIPQDGYAWLAFGLTREHAAADELVAKCLASVAQHAAPERVDEATRFARGRCGSDDLAAQAAVCRPLFDGVGRRSDPGPASAMIDPWSRELATRVLAAAAGSSPPPPAALLLAIDVAAKREMAAVAGPLVKLVSDGRAPDDVREKAATAALALDRDATVAAMMAVLGDGRQPEGLRRAIAGRLGWLAVTANSTKARESLAGALPTAPAALQQPIAVALAGNREGAERLLAAVAAGKASARLLQDKQVRGLVVRWLPDAEPRLESLTKNLPSVDEQVQSLIARVAADHGKQPPAPDRGAAVFRRICVNCHRFDNVGALIGPQLEGVGQRGTRRLLEDILDPNRNVDEAFRTTTITTTDGRVVSGLKLRDEGGEIVLADAAGKEVRIAAGEVDETAVSPLSPMPANLAAQIGEQDLPALIDYLARRGPATSATSDAAAVAFERTVVDPVFRSEGVAVADVNKDGKLDILLGDYWYEGPGWRPHEIREPGDYKDGSASGTAGYSRCFLCWADDVDGDSWVDLVVVGFPGQKAHWYANPKGGPGRWQEHLIAPVAHNETPQYVDLLGTGRRGIVMGNAKMQLVFATPGKDPTQPWETVAIGPEKGPGGSGHGLGVGDINGDGRLDVLAPGGWYDREAATDGTASWRLHVAPGLGGQADIIPYDVDGDGTMDAIGSSGHGYGIWACLQRPKEGAEPEFVRQMLFPKLFSQSHALACIDVDGDGLKDLVTGKRRWAHGPTGDADPMDPPVLYWFQAKKKDAGGVDFLPHKIDNASGIGTQFWVGDINGDRRTDILVSNKMGVHLFEQTTR